MDETLKAAKLRAEIELLKLEKATKLVELEDLKVSLEKSQLALYQARREEKYITASNAHHTAVDIWGEIEINSAAKTFEAIRYYKRVQQVDPNFAKSLSVSIHSPGGTLLEGFGIYNELVALKRNGWHVRAVVFGEASSMAAVILQAASVRVAGPESLILIHEPASGMVGNVNKLLDEAKFVQQESLRIANIFVERSGGKLSKRTLLKNWTRKDWWLTADEALKLGVIDEIGA